MKDVNDDCRCSNCGTYVLCDLAEHDKRVRNEGIEALEKEICDSLYPMGERECVREIAARLKEVPRGEDTTC